MNPHRRRRRLLIAAVLWLAAASGAAWLVPWHAPDERTAAQAQRAAPDHAHADPSMPTSAVPSIGRRRPAPQAHPPGRRGAAVEPHPITPERLRLEEQHQLFDQVEAAIQAWQFDDARALLREHQARFSEPEAWTDLREGWQAIADCLERPGPEAQARGRSFVDEERGSSMRRRVRRACLQDDN